MERKTGVELLSKKLVQILFQNVSTEEKEVLMYGATVLLSTLGAYLVLIVVSSLFNVTFLTVTAAVTASLLRIFSGGVHSSEFKYCVLSGTIVFITMGLIANNFGYKIENINMLVLIVLVIGSFIIYFYAPAEIKEKPITSHKKKARFKIYSFIVFSVLLVFYYIINLKTNNDQFVLAGLLGALWQLFTLTPLAYKLFNREYNI
ncbi:accessory gene regulator ArgB-like protein [Sporohalobacter salinus]|uniref:accessory gene regulator ArgB-like protein n=1 Tax=Sporohalobacter salinus TaxID=1494606 RepID=UPI0019614B06|nr:accessory gene regulator B family protein [Sporohalobacter salinus]MBM7623128.1 accessory gene regulator B [Sporohalobacter salinus]